MVRSALPALPLDELDLLIVENVGNLVCPAEFRIGEDARVMVSSVAEGEDKPLKYPLMFRACELVLVNKIDLLPHVDFDVDHFLAPPRRRPPGRASTWRERAHRRGRWTAFRDWLVALRTRAEVARVTQTVPAAALERRLDAAERFFGGEARADRAALPPHGRAVRARRAPDRARALAGGALGRRATSPSSSSTR